MKLKKFAGLLLAVVFGVSIATVGRAESLITLFTPNNTDAPVNDFHMQVKNTGVGNVNFIDGTYGIQFVMKTNKIAAANITGDGTPTLALDLNVNVADGESLVVNLRFAQSTGELIENYYWTINGTRVPKNQNGNAPTPGFKLEGNQQYTLFNDFDVPLGIHGLQFLLNAPELSFGQLDQIDPSTQLPGPWSDPVSDFVLQPGGSQLFNFGTLAPGTFFFAKGAVFDDQFQVPYSEFIHGVRVPEPGNLVLLGIGALVTGWFAARRCRGIGTKK